MAAGLGSLRPVACVAALNACAQGLVGVVLGVLALCVCFCALGQAPQASSNDFAQYLTYYLQGDACSSTDYGLFTGLTGATALRVWMALSLFFSVSMTVSSVVLVVAVVGRWADEKLQIALVSWIFINIFTAVDDVILGYVFSTDYTKALSSAGSDTLGPVAVGMVAFLALRGFYLWLLNFLFILYLARAARALHSHVNRQRQISRGRSSISSNWPVLEDFGKNKPEVDRSTLSAATPTPTAINPRLSERLENGETAKFPEHSALARWPVLNGQPHTMRERSSVGEDVRDRRSKTLREPSFRRQQGEENEGYEREQPFYVRLQSETGSTRDFEDRDQGFQEWGVSRSQSRDWGAMNPVKGSSQWDLPRSLDRSRRDTSDSSSSGLYRQPSSDPWRDKSIPAPPAIQYPDELEVPIPPVDYPMEPEPRGPGALQRPLSLQEAILDRTLRLKKVPDELKKCLK